MTIAPGAARNIGGIMSPELMEVSRTELIRSYDIEAIGASCTRLTCRSTSTPPRVTVREFSMSKEDFLATHPRLARGEYFHIEFAHGKWAGFTVYDHSDAMMGTTGMGTTTAVSVVTEPASARPCLAARVEVDPLDLLESVTGPGGVEHTAQGVYAKFIEQGRVGLVRGEVSGEPDDRCSRRRRGRCRP